MSLSDAISGALSKVTRGAAEQIGAVVPPRPTRPEPAEPVERTLESRNAAMWGGGQPTPVRDVNKAVVEIEPSTAALLGNPTRRTATVADKHRGERMERNIRTLTAQGWSFADALVVSGAPDIIDRTQGVEDTARWASLYEIGEQLKAKKPEEAEKAFNALPSADRRQLREMGYDPATFEVQEQGLVGDIISFAAGEARRVSAGALNAVSNAVVEEMGDTIDLAESIVEQTAQRGYRAVDYAWREKWQAGEFSWAPNGADQTRWLNAWKIVGDGDNTFRPGTDEKMMEIAEAAGGTEHSVAFAKLVAAGKTDDDILEHIGITEEDEGYGQTVLQLRDLRRDPMIQELAAFAERNKLSPGRTIAQHFDDNPTISGLVDGTWRMLADPFLVGGKWMKGRRTARALPNEPGAALPAIRRRLDVMVDDTGKVLSERKIRQLDRPSGTAGPPAVARTFIDQVTDTAARGADEAGVIDMADDNAYYGYLNQGIRDGKFTPESAAMIEMIDHAVVGDGAWAWRYHQIHPEREVLFSRIIEKAQELRTDPTIRFTPEQTYRILAQEVQDNLLPATMATGLGHTRRVQGLFLPRLTWAGTLRAGVMPRMNAVIDWSLQKAPKRLLSGSDIRVTDLEKAEATLDEWVRHNRADDVAPTRLEDFGAMRAYLESKGYADNAIADALTRRVLVDIGVNETHGLDMDALARYTMLQGEHAEPIYQRVLDAIDQVEDLHVDKADLKAAYEQSLDHWRDVFAGMPHGYHYVAGLLNDASFNKDLNELAAIFRGAYLEYLTRHRVVSPEEVKRLRGLYGQDWVKEVANPDKADTRRLWRRMLPSKLGGGRMDPTGGAKSYADFVNDVLQPLVQRGSFRSLDDFLEDVKDVLRSEYDEELLTTLRERVNSFRWDSDMGKAAYQVRVGGIPQYLVDVDPYERQLTRVLGEWQAAEIEGLEHGQALLQGKLRATDDLDKFAEVGQRTQALAASALAKALRPITLFTRKVPKLGYIPFHGPEALGEFEKFLNLGVYGRRHRELVKRWVRTTDAGRRSVLFAAKRAMLEDTGILYNPHALDFVNQQLYEADFYYGGLKWIDNQGHARYSALLPDVQTAGAMSIPDIETIQFNAQRNALMSRVSPVNGELSYLTKRYNAWFKQMAVLAPRLILRAGGLDESLSVVARHGVRDTTRIYAQSTLSRMRATALRREVERDRYRRITSRARLSKGDKLPDFPTVQMEALLGNRDQFLRRHAKVRAINAYHRALSRTADPKDPEMVDAMRGLRRFGMKPDQMHPSVAPEWVDEMLEKAAEEQLILQKAIDDGLVPDILDDWHAFDHWVRTTELEGMFDARLPIREATAPGLHDGAKYLARFADRLINIGNKMGLDMDEDMLRAVNRLANDPILQAAYNKNVMQTSIVSGLIDVDPTQPLDFAEVEAILRLRDDTGEFSRGTITDLLGMWHLGTTGQMLSASDMANIPMWGRMGMVLPHERRRIGDLLDNFADIVPTPVGVGDDVHAGGTTRWHHLFDQIRMIDRLEERNFALARAYFAMAPDSFKKQVWDILTDQPEMRNARLDLTAITAVYRDHLRKHGLDPDAFDVTEKRISQLMNVYTGPDRQAAWLLAWNDEAFRPSVPYANVNVLRGGGTGVFFHGSNAPLQSVRSMDEAIRAGFDFDSRMATGPGLYVTHHGSYAAGYEYMAQQRGRTDLDKLPTMNRLTLRPEKAHLRVMSGGWPEMPLQGRDKALFDSIVNDWAADAVTRDGVGTDLAYQVAGVENPRHLWREISAYMSTIRRAEDQDEVVREVRSLFKAFEDAGIGAFADHDAVFRPGATLGDTLGDDEWGAMVIIADDAVDVTDPVPFSLTGEAVEAELADQGARWTEELDRWSHWVIGDFDEVEGRKQVVDAVVRDLRHPGRRPLKRRHDMYTADNDYRYGVAGNDIVTVFVPRSKKGMARTVLNTDQLAAGDQFYADAQVAQGALTGETPPHPGTSGLRPEPGTMTHYDLLGSPDPAEAQRLLEFYSNGRPQDWELVEVVVRKDDFLKRSAATPADDPRVRYVTDRFRENRRSNAKIPVARTQFDDGVDRTIDVDASADPFRQLAVVTKAEVENAGVVTGELGEEIVQRVLATQAERFRDLQARMFRHTDGLTRPEGMADREWLADRILQARHLDPDGTWDYVVAGAIGAANMDRPLFLLGDLRAFDRGTITDDEMLHAIANTLLPRDEMIKRHLQEMLEERIAAGKPLLPSWWPSLNPADPGYRPHLMGKTEYDVDLELGQQLVDQLFPKMTDAYGLPAAQVLGPASLGRFRADMVQDMNLRDVPVELIRPRLNAAVFEQPDGTLNIVKLMRRSRDTAFDLIGRGIAELSRTPQFLRHYRDALVDARALRKPSPAHQALDAKIRDRFGDMYDEMNEVLQAELGFATDQISTRAQVQDIADTEFEKLAGHFGIKIMPDTPAMAEFKKWAAGELALQNLEHMQASTAAFRRTALYIDDTRVRSHFSALFDVIWPFTYATEQFITRWINTTIHSPETLRRMSLYYQGFYNYGVINEDANGAHYYEIPFSGTLTKGLAWASQWLPVYGVDPDMVPDTNMRGQVAWTFAGTTDPLELSAGPTLALPLAALRPFAPQAVIPIEELLISELGQGNSPLETVMPSTLQRFTGAFRSDIDDSLTIAAMQYIAAYAPELEPTWEEGPDGEILAPTPDDFAKYQAEVGRVSRILHLARGITGLFSPAAPTFNLDPENLAPEFYEYLERGIPHEEAVAQFLIDNPTATAYTVSKTTSAGGAPIDPTQETLELLNANREFYDAYDLAGAYLLPHSGLDEEDFDPQAWTELQKLGYKVYKTSDEWFRAYAFAEAATEFFPASDKIKEAKAALKGDRNVTARKAIDAGWRQWKEAFFSQHPIFADEYGTTEARNRRRNLRADMRRALDDERVPEGVNAELYRELLDGYDDIQRLLEDPQYDSDQKRAVHSAYAGWALDKVRGNFMAQAFFERAILRDLDLGDA